MAPRTANLLGSYILPGVETNPLPGLKQATEAERLGLGTVWLSELQGPMKDAGAVLGFVGALTSKIAMGTSISHFGTRHPMVLASWGLTMQAMTGGRFRFGFGRGTPQRWKGFGLPIPTLASLEDHAGLLRRLWAHEKIIDHDGPAGRFPSLVFEDFPDVAPPPLLLAAIGPKTVALAGKAFDGVLLHPFITPQGVATSRAIAHAAAEQAGRDPAQVKIIAQVVMSPDMTQAQIDKAVFSRFGAYMAFPGIGDLISTANGWDPAEVASFRQAAAEAVEANKAAGSPLKGRDVLIAPARRLPAAWLSQSAGMGSGADCAATLHSYFDAGADEVVCHGVTPDGLESTVRAFVAAG